jgi:hypothetical protein
MRSVFLCSEPRPAPLSKKKRNREAPGAPCGPMVSRAYLLACMYGVKKCANSKFVLSSLVTVKGASSEGKREMKTETKDG